MRKNNTTLKSDDELICLYKQTRDLIVLGDLYSRYMHLVYGLCLKYMKNRDDSKDAVNIIFEKLIKDVLRFEIKNFKSWLYVITKRFCLMQLRSAKSIDGKKDDYLYVSFMETTQCLHPIDRDDSNTSVYIKTCIDKLKDIQRESVCLFYFDELSYKQISDKIEVSEKKVKSYIQNAKRNLKICLEKLTSIVDE